MDLKQHIGVRVKAARQRKGLTQEQLAEAIGKAVETVSNIERGALLTGIETLQKIGAALNTSLAYFFEGAEDERNISRARLEEEQRLLTIGQRLSGDDLRLAVGMLEVLERHRAGNA